MGSFKILKLTLDVIELQTKSKKRSKVFLNGSFLSSLVGGGNSLFNIFKGGHLKKSLGNSDLDNKTKLNKCFTLYDVSLKYFNLL